MESKTAKEPPRFPTDGYVTADQAARLLRISRFTLYYWASGRKIPHYRVGRRVMFCLKDLKVWMDEHKVKEVG